jgi:hypothetical protein
VVCRERAGPPGPKLGHGSGLLRPGVDAIVDVAPVQSFAMQKHLPSIYGRSASRACPYFVISGGAFVISGGPFVISGGAFVTIGGASAIFGGAFAICGGSPQQFDETYG